MVTIGCRWLAVGRRVAGCGLPEAGCGSPGGWLWTGLWTGRWISSDCRGTIGSCPVDSRGISDWPRERSCAAGTLAVQLLSPLKTGTSWGRLRGRWRSRATGASSEYLTLRGGPEDTSCRVIGAPVARRGEVPASHTCRDLALVRWPVCQVRCLCQVRCSFGAALPSSRVFRVMI
jgi:hypothetical protein